MQLPADLISGAPYINTDNAVTAVPCNNCYPLAPGLAPEPSGRLTVASFGHASDMVYRCMPDVRTAPNSEVMSTASELLVFVSSLCSFNASFGEGEVCNGTCGCLGAMDSLLICHDKTDVKQCNPWKCSPHSAVVYSAVPDMPASLQLPAIGLKLRQDTTDLVTGAPVSNPTYSGAMLAPSPGKPLSTVPRSLAALEFATCP